jgi:exodeoxyribonuclease-1
MYPASRGCAAVVAPLAMHPGNKNGVIVFDLSADPTPLLTLSADAIRARLFTRSADLADGIERMPLKVVHLNKCPVLTTVKLLDPAAQERLGIDLAQCERHWQQLLGADLKATLHEVFSGSEFEPATDPEQQLYSAFLNDADKHTCDAVRHATPEQLATQTFAFDDRRLPELLFRYRARHFPQTLSAPEQAQWQQFRMERLTDPAAGAGIVLEEYLQQLDTLEGRADIPAPQRTLLLSLRHWAADLGL